MKETLLSKLYKYISLSILGMLGISFYILADTYFIANGIGSEGLTALNLAIPVYSIIHATGLMLGIGGATRYNIQKSCNNGDGANQTYTATLRLGLLFGFIYFFVGASMSEFIAKLLGADKYTIAMTATYLKTILCFSPFFILNNILISFIRNDGCPKTAMAGMLTGSISNIILDYIFVFPCAMGMFGAAFATGLAPIISMGVMSIYFFKKRNQFHIQKNNHDNRLWFNICSLGISAFITEIASGVILIVYNLLLLRMSGNTAVAAYGIIANLSLVAASIFTGIGQGIQPLLSHYYSMREQKIVNRILRLAILLSFLISSSLYAIILLTGNNIVNLFNRESDALLNSIALNGLNIYFTGFFFAGINIVLSSSFCAIENVRTGFLISCLRGFILIVPLAVLFSLLSGINGVWLTFPVSEAVVFLIGVIKFRHLTKKQIEVPAANGFDTKAS